jgi:hypothetical protein
MELTTDSHNKSIKEMKDKVKLQNSVSMNVFANLYYFEAIDDNKNYDFAIKSFLFSIGWAGWNEGEAWGREGWSEARKRSEHWKKKSGWRGAKDEKENREQIGEALRKKIRKKKIRIRI